MMMEIYSIGSERNHFAILNLFDAAVEFLFAIGFVVVVLMVQVCSAVAVLLLLFCLSKKRLTSRAGLQNDASDWRAKPKLLYVTSISSAVFVFCLR
jgi:hypothetical protein